MASVLYVIMNSIQIKMTKSVYWKIDANVKRVSKKVIYNEGKKLIQEELKSIYNWKKETKMQFNAINKLTINLAAGPDGITTVFLINTKDYIKLLLKLNLIRNMDERSS